MPDIRAFNADERSQLAKQIIRFLHGQRPSGRSRHANPPGSSPAVQEIITPHIPQKKIGPPFFNFPLYFSKVADLRFNTFLDTKRAISRCWRSLRALTMLPIDSPSNSTLNGMFASHFRKRSLAKIDKLKKSPRSATKSKQEKKSRLKSDFSNLVKSAFPGFRLISNLKDLAWN